MHQKTFGGHAGELKHSPGPLAAIWGLLLRGRGAEERRKGGEGSGKGNRTPPHTCLATGLLQIRFS